MNVSSLGYSLMKTALPPYILFPFLVLLLSSCQTGAENRISENPALYKKLSTTDRALVAAGDVRTGMSKDAVYLAWGRPDMVRESTTTGNISESWAYFVTRPVPTSSLSYANVYRPFYGRYGIHPRFGYCRGIGWHYNSVDYVHYTSKTITFSGNYVVAWEQTR
jgi:hypothetical protein